MLLQTFGLVVVCISFLIFCLKIKSTKKSQELLGTAGTVKTIEAVRCELETTDGQVVSLRPSPLPSSSRGLSLVSGERKLPELPPSDVYADGSIASDVYATVGTDGYDGAKGDRVNAGGEEVTDDSDGEEPSTSNGAIPKRNRVSTSGNHPYAKVKKRVPKEHPYATVKKPAPSPPASTSSGAVNTAQVNFDPLDVAGDAQTISPPASSQDHCRAGQQQEQRFFSGDSQDSTKGYTSISVREPLSHIQCTFPSTSCGVQNSVRPGRVAGQDATYIAVSETSDDMYAAIEDPSYIPTGTSQSNSDTYAVINVPDEDADGGDVLRRNAAASRSPSDEKLHTYSRIDMAKKRRPPEPSCHTRSTMQVLPPRPHSQVPQPPVPNSTDASRRSLNVDEMYAKVQKPPGEQQLTAPVAFWSKRKPTEWGSQEVQGLPSVVARTSPVRGREKSSSNNNNHVFLGSGGIPPPSSKVKTATVARHHLGNVCSQQYLRPVSQPQLPTVTTSSSGNHASSSYNGADAGYEPVNDVWSAKSRVQGADGYELVGDKKSVRKESGKNDPGYETVSNDRREPNRIAEPPYAKLHDSEAEEEEGYETIPPNEAGHKKFTVVTEGERLLSYDPGYEVVPNATSDNVAAAAVEPSYETLNSKKGSKEPGYETVKTEPNYEVVPMYSDPVDVVSRNMESPEASRKNSLHNGMSARRKPSTSSVSSQGSTAASSKRQRIISGNERRSSSSSSVILIERIGSSISMVASPSADRRPPSNSNSVPQEFLDTNNNNDGSDSAHVLV